MWVEEERLCGPRGEVIGCLKAEVMGTGQSVQAACVGSLGISVHLGGSDAGGIKMNMELFGVNL